MPTYSSMYIDLRTYSSIYTSTSLLFHTRTQLSHFSSTLDFKFVFLDWNWNFGKSSTYGKYFGNSILGKFIRSSSCLLPWITVTPCCSSKWYVYMDTITKVLISDRDPRLTSGWILAIILQAAWHATSLLYCVSPSN